MQQVRLESYRRDKNQQQALLRIRFTYQGQRKAFNLGLHDSVPNRKAGERIAKQMELDMISGNFDPTLSKYKPNRTTKSVERPLLEVWDGYVGQLNLSAKTKNGHYHCIRKMIEKHQPNVHDGEWYERLRDIYGASTFNARRQRLNSCLKWAIANELAKSNPYANMAPKRETRPDRVDPFSPCEIRQILDAFGNDTFCPKFSAYKHSQYLPLIKFMFYSGCRLGEAIALQWGQVDFESHRILIDRALSKDIGTNANASRRIMSATKTGEVGYVPLKGELLALIGSLQDESCHPEDYVFRGHRGLYISLESFRDVWRQVLHGLGIRYRPPYQMKHTCLSQVATQQGILAAAKLARHKSAQTTMKHYSRFVDDVDLPNY